MAFKVGAVTVIDDSRNITNTGSFQASLGATNGTDGQVLMSSATGTRWVSGAVLSGPLSAGYVGINTFTTPGTFTVGTNCPSTITAIRIYGCGGGGNGGTGQPYPAVFNNTRGGGGGGVSVFSSEMRKVTNGQVFTITIAAAGGNTTVTTPPGTNITFTGGAAGAAGPAGGASGAAGSSPNGDIINSSYVQAAAGGLGFSYPTTPTEDHTAGGVGGAGGSNIVSHLGLYTSTRLGTGGAGGVGPAGPASPTAGSAGTGSGSGGGGGAGGGSINFPSSPGKAGGAGRPGIVVIVY